LNRLHHNVKYTPTTCTTTIDINLEWSDFEKLYATISFNPSLERHALEVHTDLTQFLRSWDSYRRFKYIPFIGPYWTPPNLLEARIRREGITP